jgi:hypothetical protein
MWTMSLDKYLDSIQRKPLACAEETDSGVIITPHNDNHKSQVDAENMYHSLQHPAWDVEVRGVRMRCGCRRCRR